MNGQRGGERARVLYQRARRQAWPAADFVLVRIGMGLRFVGFRWAAHGCGARFREEPRGESSLVLGVEWGRAPRISGVRDTSEAQPSRRVLNVGTWISLAHITRIRACFFGRGGAGDVEPTSNDLGNYELHRALRLPTKHVRKWSENRGGLFWLGRDRAQKRGSKRGEGSLPEIRWVRAIEPRRRAAELGAHELLPT